MPLKRTLLLFAAFTLIASAGQAATVRTLEETLSLEADDTLVLDFPVGELRVEGTSGQTVEVTVEIECSSLRRRCKSAAEEIEIEVRQRSTRVVVEVGGWPRWGTGGMKVSLVARVPRRTPLQVDMGVGQVQVRGLHSNVSVDLGVGEVEVEMDADRVRSVDLDSGIGESSVAVNGSPVKGRRSFLGGEIDWSEGTGTARIEVDLGVGAIDIDLN